MFILMHHTLKMMFGVSFFEEEEYFVFKNLLMKNESCAFYALVIASKKIPFFPKKYFILYFWSFQKLPSFKVNVSVLSKGLVKLLHKMKCEDNLITFWNVCVGTRATGQNYFMIWNITKSLQNCFHPSTR